MARISNEATARVLDFSRCVDDGYRAQVTAINGGKGIRHPLDIVDGPTTYFERKDGSLGYIDREVSEADIARAEAILADVIARDGRRSEYFKHPDLRDIPVMMLRRIAYGDKGVMTKKDQEPVSDGTGMTDHGPTVWAATDLDKPRPRKWLAKNRIPRGAVTVLVGDEGIGKSLFWVWIVVAVSTGNALPEFGIPARKGGGHVRLILTEDDWTTTHERLVEAGANLTNISIVCSRKDGSVGSVTIPGDEELLYQDPVPVLTVIDALADTMPPMNTTNTVQVRKVLSVYQECAEATQGAIILVSHTNRDGNAKSTRDKFGLSGELRKKARMTLYAQEDGQGCLSVGPDKTNTSRGGNASLFRIDAKQARPATDDDDGTVPVLTYVADDHRTANETVRENANDVKAAKVPVAATWLEDLLSDGPVWASKARESAKAHGFSDYSVTQAREYLAIKVRKENKHQGQWYWSMEDYPGPPGHDENT